MYLSELSCILAPMVRKAVEYLKKLSVLHKIAFLCALLKSESMMYIRKRFLCWSFY